MNPGRLEDGLTESIGGAAASAASSSARQAGVFAAAAPALVGGAAEEVLLEVELEKELAGEVELWRMEASGGVVFQSLLHGGGTGGAGGLSGGLAPLPLGPRPAPQGGRVAATFDKDRSLSPPPRTQVSLHDRLGVGGPQPRASAEASPHQRRLSPPRSRAPLAAHSRTVTSLAGPEALSEHSGDTSDADAAAGRPAAASLWNAAAAGASKAAAPPASDAVLRQTGGGGRESAEAVFGMRGREEPRDLSEGRPVAGAASEDWSLPPERPPEEPPASPRPQPTRRDSGESSSSEESTFAGFIEDPLECQRTAEAPAWLTSGSAPSLAPQPVGDGEVAEIPVPALQLRSCLRSVSELSEGVRSDRARF